MNTCKIALGCLVLAAASAYADREVRYFVGGTSSKNALLDASYWKDSNGTVGTAGNPLDSEIDYVNKSGSAIYTPSTSAVGGGAFNVHSLTLGEVGGSSGSIYVYTTGQAEMTFGEGGVVFNKGSLVAQWYPLTFAGLVTIGSPADAAYQFNNYYKNTKFTFKGKFKGAAGTGATFVPHGNGMAEKTLSVEFLDCTEYQGTLFVGSASTAYTTTTTIFLGSDMPGIVNLRRTGRLMPLYGTNVVTLGSLTLAAGATLEVGSRIWQDEGQNYCGTSGCFKVTGAFSATAPIRVCFDENAVVPNGATCRVPVLTVPDDQVLSASDFTIVSPANDCVQVGEFQVVENTAAHTKTLVAVFEPVVMMTRSDAMNLNYAGANAITNGACWSDGLSPHGGAHYLVRAIPGNSTNVFKFSTCLHSLSGQTSSDVWSTAYNQTFPGLSLTLGKSCCFLLAAKKFTCGKLRILDGGGVCASLWICQASPALAGGIEVPAGATAYFGAPDRWTVEAAVTGGGTLRLPGPFSATSTRAGGVQFKDLTGFSGKVITMEFEAAETGSGNGHWPSYDASYQTLYIGAAAEYGGVLGELDYFGTTLARYSRLVTTASVTIPASCNSGLYVNGTYGGIVYVDKTGNVPHVLDLGVPLTLNGSMVKDGPGCLKLRGEARFGTDASVTPTANKNILEVRAGSLEVASAACLDGVAISFTNDTKLVINVSTNNADFHAYGLRNVKTDVPFTLKGDLDTLPLAFDISELPQAAFKEIGVMRIGLLTVKSTAAPAVRAMLPETFKPYRSSVCRVVEIPRAEMAAVTFALDIFPSGMQIMFY